MVVVLAIQQLQYMSMYIIDHDGLPYLPLGWIALLGYDLCVAMLYDIVVKLLFTLPERRPYC